MNAIASIQADAEADPWDQAISAVNAWRGHAIHCFAQAEAAVSETLLSLARLPGPEKQPRLRRLVGERFQDLAAAIGDGGPFASDGAKAAAALAAFREMESLRPFLCHGVGKVALDRHGQWVVVLKLLAFQGREEKRSSIGYDQRTAERTLADLKAASNELAKALQSLRARIGA